MNPADVVRIFHERMQERDWDGAADCLAPDIEIRYPSTGERFLGSSFLTMNRTYPDGWTITVEEVLSVGDRVTSRVRVVQDGTTFWCTGFYTVHEDRIVDGIEHWLTEGAEAPPEWRASLSSPT